MSVSFQSANQFGELSNNTITDAQALELANELPAKTGVTAVVAIAAANAATQTASYVQADVQTIATLANELKTKFDALLLALKDV